MIAVAILPAAIIAAVLATYFLLLRYADAEQAFIDRGHSLAKLFTPATEYGIFSGNAEELQRLAAALADEADVSGLVIHGRSGQPLAQLGTMRLTKDPQSLPDGWTGATGDEETQCFHAKVWRSGLAIPDLPAGQSEPTAREAIGSVTLEMSRAGMQRQKREMMQVTLLATLVTLALGTLLALRLSASVTRPIRSLQQTVGAIRGGDLEARVAPHPDSTLRNLEEGINEMARALQAGRDHLQSRIAAATAELKLKRDEAEQASIAKSRFLAAASHDLRQPLHALALFAGELEGEARQSGQQRLARQIGKAVGAMEELLGSLLDISRADLGSLDPDVQPVALNALLERVFSAHIDNARAKGLRLRLHPTRRWGLSDPALLYRMVGNLVSNAIAYSDRGGILIGVRQAGDKLRIEVRDSGIGIPPEYHALIYKEFFQVANPERDPSKGVGLGLSLVDRLSRLLDHPLGLCSAVGRGSVFSITLPRCKAVAAAGEEAASASPAGLRARLLVLGPPASDGSTVRALLSGWGCDVADTWPPSRANGAEALPDLVICDEAALADALPRLRSLAEDRPLPVILLGALPPTLLNASAGLSLHALTKPLQPAKLRALVSFLLDDADASAPA
jgi:signal transduction histidine kinase